MPPPNLPCPLPACPPRHVPGRPLPAYLPARFLACSPSLSACLPCLPAHSLPPLPAHPPCLLTLPACSPSLCPAGAAALPFTCGAQQLPSGTGGHVHTLHCHGTPVCAYHEALMCAWFVCVCACVSHTCAYAYLPWYARTHVLWTCARVWAHTALCPCRPNAAMGRLNVPAPSSHGLLLQRGPIPCVRHPFCASSLHPFAQAQARCSRCICVHRPTPVAYAHLPVSRMPSCSLSTALCKGSALLESHCSAQLPRHAPSFFASSTFHLLSAALLAWPQYSRASNLIFIVWVCVCSKQLTYPLQISLACIHPPRCQGMPARPMHPQQDQRPQIMHLMWLAHHRPA